MRNYFILLFNFSFLVYCQGQTNYFPQTDQVGIMLNPAVSGLDRRIGAGMSSAMHSGYDDFQNKTNDSYFTIHQLALSAPISSKYYMGAYLMNRNFESDVHSNNYLSTAGLLVNYDSTYKRYHTLDFGASLSRPMYLDHKSQEESNSVLIPAVGVGFGYQNYLSKTSALPNTEVSQTENTFNIRQVTLGAVYQFRKKLLLGAKTVNYSNLNDGVNSNWYVHGSYTILAKNSKGKFMIKPSFYTSIGRLNFGRSATSDMANTNGAIYFYNQGLAHAVQLDFRWHRRLLGIGWQSLPNSYSGYMVMVGVEFNAIKATFSVTANMNNYEAYALTFFMYFNKRKTEG